MLALSLNFKFGFFVILCFAHLAGGINLKKGGRKGLVNFSNARLNSNKNDLNLLLFIPYIFVFILGIGLIIIFNNDESFKKIKKGFSYLGKISYSLYLWHFPILVLGSYLFVEFTDFKKTF